MPEITTEVLFYHLTRRPVDEVLPGLLETCAARGWRVVVQADTAQRCDALDTLLWTYRDDSFLPHSTAASEFASDQPICLTSDESTPNGATVRFYVDGAAVDTAKMTELQRAVLVFDGRNEEALVKVRQHWKDVKAAGFAPTYWQQNEAGKWEKQAA